jgi:DNA-binding response OmpR family regulator
MSNKILIVEDDPALCELIREVVSSAGMDADGMTDSSKAAILSPDASAADASRTVHRYPSALCL